MAGLPPTQHAIYWINRAPRYEIVDGIPLVTIESGDTVIQYRCTIHTMVESKENLTEACAAPFNRPDNVVPLCELCTRYDLPKHQD